MNIRFFITDVFAEKPLEGNQLATFFDFGRLDGGQMQRSPGRQISPRRHSSPRSKENKGGYDVRIFTPAEEIPFAGHPTLGTAHLIREKLIRKKVEKVVLNLKVGQIPVTFTKGIGNGMDEADGLPSSDDKFKPEGCGQGPGTGKEGHRRPMASRRGIDRFAVHHHSASFARGPETDRGRVRLAPFPHRRRTRFHPSGIHSGRAGDGSAVQREGLPDTPGDR